MYTINCDGSNLWVNCNNMIVSHSNGYLTIAVLVFAWIINDFVKYVYGIKTLGGLRD